MGGCRLLYFSKSKNGSCFIVFYVNAFILLYFLRWQEGGRGGNRPPKSTTACIATDIAIYIQFNGFHLYEYIITTRLHHFFRNLSKKLLIEFHWPI